MTLSCVVHGNSNTFHCANKDVSLNKTTAPVAVGTNPIRLWQKSKDRFVRAISLVAHWTPWQIFFSNISSCHSPAKSLNHSLPLATWTTGELPTENSRVKLLNPWNHQSAQMWYCLLCRRSPCTATVWGYSCRPTPACVANRNANDTNGVMHLFCCSSCNKGKKGQIK